MRNTTSEELRGAGGKDAANGDRRANVEDIYPLSPMQEGMVFQQQLAPTNGVYLIQYCLTLDGDLDAGNMRQAWASVYDRHAVLRSSFVFHHGDRWLQVVRKQVDLPWQQHDWRHLGESQQQAEMNAFLAADRQLGIDFSQAPMSRLTCFRTSDDTWQLIWTFHHASLEGWSASLVLQEVLALYAGAQRGHAAQVPKRRPYRDYIAWIYKQDQAQAATFWRNTFAGCSRALLPDLDHKPEQRRAHPERYSQQKVQLSEGLTQRLSSLAKQHRLTLSTLAHGAWSILLSRYAGRDDVVFGSLVSGRNPALDGAELMIGLFVNSLPIRTRVPAAGELLPWMVSLQTTQLEMQQYDYCSLTDVHRWSGLPQGEPFFDTTVVFENWQQRSASTDGDGEPHVREVRVLERDVAGPLMLIVAPGERMTLVLRYDPQRFYPETMERMLANYQTILEGIAADPNRQVGEIPYLSESERHRLTSDLNQTEAEYKKDACVHDLIQAQARRSPTEIAVRCGDRSLTYRELESRSNQMAHYLGQVGVKGKDLVAIHMDRSLEMMVALLGTWKAGAAYVPLDPAYPQRRIAYMLRDAGNPLTLTQSDLASELPAAGDLRTVCVDQEWPRIAECEARDPNLGTDPEHLAYIIYTSGSTGEPKGVQIPHRAVVNLFASMTRMPGLEQTDTVLGLTTLSFDISVVELFLPLTVGATLELVSREDAVDVHRLISKINESGVTVIQATPATWQMLVESGWEGAPNLKLISGGDLLPRDLAAELLPRCGSLWNLYGPTETTIWSTHSRVDRVQGAVPIGRPFANTQCYILDDHMDLVPQGVPGELYIGGDGLACGYRNRPEITRERFVGNPFRDSSASMLYRTGDLVRHLPDGSLDILGRIDHQVKIRGFRIELGEIESVLARHPEIAEAVVVAREDRPGDKLLVAYIVPATDSPPTIGDLREFVAASLPDYMIPAAFVCLDAFPLTPNRKIDRKALPAPEGQQLSSSKAFVAPRNERERVLASIWEDVLAVDNIGVDDNFFELGGHSLLATRLVTRVRSKMRLTLPLRQVFETPTIAGLAAYLARERECPQAAPMPPLRRVDRAEPRPLSFAQQRLWFLDQLQPGGSAYNLHFSYRLDGKLNAAALESALLALVHRHEGLRTTFSEINGVPVQRIDPSASLALEIQSLREFEPERREQMAREIVERESRQPFDLARGPVFRAKLLELREDQHILTISLHHIVADGLSIDVLVSYVCLISEAHCSSTDSPLADLVFQYVDYAAWQREWLQGAALDQQIAYWREQLGSGAPSCEFPLDRPRTHDTLHQSGTITRALPVELSSKVRELSRKSNTTEFMTLLAAFKILLSKYTGQSIITVGSPVANRDLAEMERVVGLFLNLLVLRTDLSNAETFAEALKRVRDVTLEAYSHQSVPFEKLVEELQPERDLDRPPFFQVVFNMLPRTSTKPQRLRGLTASPFTYSDQQVKVDLTCFVAQLEQQIVLACAYDKDLFDRSTVEALLEQFELLLERVAEDENVALSKLSVIGQQQQEELIASFNEPLE